MAETPNNRVSTQQFYEAQLETNKTIAEMERRIMAELKGVPTQVETNKDEIDKLRKRSNVIDTIEGLAAGLAIYLGISK